jgi:hypothetical protein
VPAIQKGRDGASNDDPFVPGRRSFMTHHYKRNGTITLFAALNVAEGLMIGECMSRHRYQE